MSEHSQDALKQLPLRHRHMEAGARMMPFAGWEMPLQYRGIIAEHEAVRNAAGIFDVSHMGRVRVEGEDSARLIRSITTYDVTRIQAGGTHYSLYCNEAGGIEDDVFIFHIAHGRWLIVHNAANAESDARRVKAAVGNQAQDVGRNTVMLAIQGPMAPDAIRRVIGPGLDTLAPRTCTEVMWHGSTVVLSRTGYTGEDGAELVVDSEIGDALWAAFLDGDVVPVGLGARETLRLEAALPLHGNDISPEITPHQARIAWAVTLEDGEDFIGRAALEREAQQPLDKRLVHLRLLDRGVPRAGYSVRDEQDNILGALTSGAFSPTLRVGIAMGYLPRDYSTPGTRVAIEVRGQRVPAEVVRRPFYRRPEPKDRSV